MLGSAASIASRLEPVASGEWRVASGERTVELVRAESPDPPVLFDHGLPCLRPLACHLRSAERPLFVEHDLGESYSNPHPVGGQHATKSYVLRFRQKFSILVFGAS